MKLRDDIGLIDQGMASLCLPPADKWVVAYHQVPDTHPPDRKIPGCSSVYGVLVGTTAGVPTLCSITLDGSMACGASMPCGAGTTVGCGVVGSRRFTVSVPNEGNHVFKKFLDLIRARGVLNTSEML